MHWLNGFSSTDIIVVNTGHRLYKEDGTDDFLEVTAGNAVTSGRKIYMVESDFHQLKHHLGDSK